MNARDQRFSLLPQAENYVNVRFMVPILYLHLLLPPNIIRDRFRNPFNTSRSHPNSKMLVRQYDFTEEVATEVVIVEGYMGTRDGIVTTDHMLGPMP